MRKIVMSLGLALGAIPAFAMDNCLVGTWQADLNGLADIMSRQMNGVATPVGGDVLMTITAGGTVNMAINNMKMNVIIPDAPPMDVFVNGVSGGSFVGEDGTWAVETANYDLIGSADVMGQRMDIPISSATGVFGGGSGSYTCSSTEILFQSDSPDPRIPPRWTRE